MKYGARYTNKFKKDLKRCGKRGYDLQLAYCAISLLCKNGTLPAEYRPHKLNGRYEGLWECHLQPDWLLVWAQNETELILLFTDTGTHADLFK